MSTKCHQKNVHEKSPKQRTFCGHFCPRDVAKSVHEMSPLLSMKCHLLCPRDVCQGVTVFWYYHIALIFKAVFSKLGAKYANGFPDIKKYQSLEKVDHTISVQAEMPQP